MTAKAPNAVDQLVGSRVRQRRMQVGLTLNQLAQALGTTVPQVQKYETGTNRIGASRLHQIARILDAPIGFFFGEAETTDPTGSEPPDPLLFTDRATTELTMAFNRIASPEVRRILLDLAQALLRLNANSGADPATDA